MVSQRPTGSSSSDGGAGKSEPVVILDLLRRKVLRYDDRIVKCGPDINIEEATTMSFIGETVKTVPVPRVLRAEKKDGTTNIEMELIKGDTLYDVWPTLSTAEKTSFAQQLGAILRDLRGLTGSYIGSVGNGPAVDVRRLTASGGPFATECEFTEFLLDNMVSRTPNMFKDMLRRELSTCKPHRIVLTHGDLHPRNIIVRDGRIVGLLDWEYSGWFPEHWEFIRFCRFIDTGLDWYEYVHIIFDEVYSREFMIDTFIGRLSRH